MKNQSVVHWLVQIKKVCKKASGQLLDQPVNDSIADILEASKLELFKASGEI